jgi:NTE family protein
LATLAAGRQLGTWGAVALGVQSGAGSASLQEGAIEPRDIDLKLGQIYAALSADTLDNAYFPSHGLKGRIQWTDGLTGLGSAENFQTGEINLLFAKGFGRHALLFNVAGGDTFDGTLSVASLFTLGGPFSFPGYSIDELTGETYAVARLGYRYKLTNNSDSLFGLPLYVGATAVAGNTWATSHDARLNNLRVGGNVYLGADTLIGPVFLTLGAAERGRKAFYLFVGKPF